jgi:type IV pilus assembly protein PilW
MKPAAKPLGFTLLELLIAMTIGLLLTVVIAQVFLGSRRTYATTDDVARLQENMRYANDVLGRALRSASYMSAPGDLMIPADGLPGIFGTGASALDGVEGNPGSSLTSAAASDILTVRFQGAADGSTVDCLGNSIAPGAVATNTYRIRRLIGVAGGPFSLHCSDPSGTEQAIVQNVENMQILYGEETTGDFNVDRYVPRDLVTSMDRVIAVRIALLFQTPNTNVRATPDTTQYDMHGIKLPVFNGTEATRIRRVMTVTYTLRNRSP